MKLLVAIPILMLGAASTPSYGAEPVGGRPGPTVNDYTSNQAARAETAAHREGFQNVQIAAVQDGNFFLIGEKNGTVLGLTVTPNGKTFPAVTVPNS